MTPLTFNLKIRPKYTLDIAAFVPHRLQERTLTEIRQIELIYGKEKVSAHKIFDISGENPEHILIKNSCDKLAYVGQNMSMGHIHIEGNVGPFLGKGLSGGHITVNGNAGAWVGNKMSGGQIKINGHALDYVGAGMHGDAFGMTNGMIYIQGNAGDRIGDRMRRGLILVRGNAGHFCGSRIHAGTIIALDKIGLCIGNSMRRGTILLARQPASIPSTFKSCGILKMQFLQLLFKQLIDMDKTFTFLHQYSLKAHRFSGDFARAGKGEILILQVTNNQ